MNWKSFLIGVGVGIAGGYAASEIISQKSTISPEKVLVNVKNAFKENGSINGSWINMTMEPYEKDGFHYKVFRGGITRNHDGIGEQYEFIADAKTGVIIEVQKI
ncbi:peptidase M4 [Bacillus massilinigeriensis]|uniref:peptidase M4 n=1 Tax=Bacillus massilionigeriensis TaxID=1805475 RepID=UPI00096B20CD|nr:peptidase M4 [Bacillus massilionigeriensis]